MRKPTEPPTRTRRGPPRTLCGMCLGSFDRAELEHAGGELRCPACRGGAAEPEPRSPAPTSPRRVPHHVIEAAPVPWWLALRGDAAHWCRDRCWWVRAPLLVYLGYILTRHWAEPGGYRSVFDGINLGIHELGHEIFKPFGRFLCIAGGTITQLAAPVGSVFMFLKQRDYFAISVCGAWLATNLWNVAVYMGDARAQKLALVAPGVGLMPPGEGAHMHDWANMLGDLGLIQWDTTLSWLVTGMATATMFASLACGGWLLFRMAVPAADPIEDDF